MRPLLLLLVCLCGLGQALAETRYVTDQTEIALRRGESPRHKIVRMLPSGAAVKVTKSNESSGYSQVRTADGTQGYVLTRELLPEPVARDRIATLEARLAELQQAPGKLAAQLNQLESEHDARENAHEELQKEKNRLEQELATIKKASADVVGITEERAELRKSVADLTREKADLQQKYDDLDFQRDQRWFLIGAVVVAGGILIGLILPHLRFRRRKSSWGSL